MSKQKIENIERHVYEPGRLVDNTIAVIEDRIANPQAGILTGIPGVSDFLMPWRSGEMIGIVAFTSNGKSSFMNYVVNQHAHKIRSIRQENPDYVHGIAYFTWEQSVEEQTVIDLSRVTQINAAKMFKGDITAAEMERIRGAGAEHRKSLPIWLIGHSIKDDRRRPRLSMDDVLEAVIWMEEKAGLSLDLIVIDYLQRIRRRSGLETREGYMDAVDSCKDLAMRCPTMVASQAKRDVIERNDPMPGLDDSQETSNFEQSCDHYIAMYMPKQKIKIGGFAFLNDQVYLVSDDLVFIAYLKQKMGRAPVKRAYKMGYGGTSLTEIPLAETQMAQAAWERYKKEKGIK